MSDQKYAHKMASKGRRAGERELRGFEDRESRRNPEKAETECEHKVQKSNGKRAA